ncbi:MAG: choice-of-anchor tandem repeat GloVer-containing protein [Verrucomicrobiota bacterium]
MKLIENLRWTAGMLALWLWAPWACGDVTFSPLVIFDGTNGASPKGGLIQGQDGSFYGTTVEGGATNAGTVFCLSADGRVFKTLYSFTGAADGANPSAALAQGGDGNFYGTAYNGGAGNSGTLFQITPAGDFTLLASLSGTNGAQPDAALIQASDGSWYGTADDGGPYTNVVRLAEGTVVLYQAEGYGSIFRLTTNGQLTTPVFFNNSDGTRAGALTQGPDGNFYGTTVWGGLHTNSSPYVGFGTIFKMSTNGLLTTLYSFTGGADGGWPYAGLVLGNDGSFYGTASNGGRQYYGYGAIFQVTPDGTYTKLYAFAYSDGATPYAGLIQGSDGNLYGTTYAGGAHGVGTVFRVTTDGALTTLHSFAGAADGSNPLGSLVQGNDGNFYGTAATGGAYSNGVIFRVSVPLPPVIRSVAATTDGVALTWSTVATQSYQVQYTSSLAQTNWNNLGSPLTAASGTLAVTDIAPSDPQRWYRILALP